jgi:hypothetical protein
MKTRSFVSDKCVTAIVTICTFAFHVGPKLYADSAETVMLKEGTEVKLKFAEDISSRTAALDDPVTLMLSEDLKVGDVTIGQAGAKAFATVSNVKKAGMMGKPGELNIRLDSLKVSGGKIKLRGSKGREGRQQDGDRRRSHCVVWARRFN